MRSLIIITLHFISLPVFSQTSYADFIQFDNKIQWAAMYDQLLDMTQPIRKYGIREILFQQMQKKGGMDNFIINKNNIARSTIDKAATLPIIDSFTDNRNPFRPFTYASPENEAEYIMREKNCSCDGSAGSNKLDIYRIKQLLYYKNSKMYVKNILVTPVCLKRSVTDGYHSQFVWQYAYSSCYNDSRDSLTADQKKKCIDLGNAEQLYDLRYDFTNDSAKAEIFTLKNPSFSRHLYDDIQNNKVTVVDDQYKIILNKKVLQYKLDRVTVVMYDTEGEGLGGSRYITMVTDLNLDSIYEFAINQHFYFDTANNILYSTVNHIDVYRHVITSLGIDLGSCVYYRIYFVKPSLYKRPVN